MTQVIIDDIIPRTQLTASTGQTVFNTNWTADVASDIDVYARADGVEPDDATQLVSPSDYNVTFIGASETVRVTFLSGRTLDDIITIVRNTPSTRMNLYINTNFVPSMLNQDFGILTLVDQQAQMYDTVVNPGYNVSATIANKDKILPILGANQIWAMNDDNDEIITFDVPSSGGLAPKLGTYLVQTATSELPNAQAMGALASGFVVNTTSTGVQLTRILTGTTNQITIADGSGISGNPTFSISPNPVLSGTAGMGIPQGTTAQRVIPVSGIGLRYNTDLQDVEYWDGAQWVQFADPVGEALTAVDDTNVTLVLGGSPLTALVNAASLTLGWTGELSPARGGTGVNNGTSTLTLAGNLATSGAFASTFTMTGATNVTFPTSGTLATTTGTVSSVSGTANRITSTGGTTPVIDIAANPILPGTGGVTLPSGTTAERAGGAGTIRFNSQSLVFESTIDGVTWATIDTHTSGDVDSITGTANQVIASSPTGNVTLSLPQSIATSSAVTFASVAFSSTSGIIGTTTNDSAAAGSVGELISSVASPGTAMTSTVAINGTSISLTAGDWDVWGSCYFNGLTMTVLETCITTTSATMNDAGLCGIVAGASLQQSNILALQRRISLASTTTVYVAARATFTGTCSLNRANIFARRVR